MSKKQSPRTPFVSTVGALFGKESPPSLTRRAPAAQQQQQQVDGSVASSPGSAEKAATATKSNRATDPRRSRTVQSNNGTADNNNQEPPAQASAAAAAAAAFPSSLLTTMPRHVHMAPDVQPAPAVPTATTLDRWPEQQERYELQLAEGDMEDARTAFARNVTKKHQLEEAAAASNSGSGATLKKPKHVHMDPNAGRDPTVPTATSIDKAHRNRNNNSTAAPDVDTELAQFRATFEARTQQRQAAPPSAKAKKHVQVAPGTLDVPLHPTATAISHVNGGRRRLGSASSAATSDDDEDEDEIPADAKIAADMELQESVTEFDKKRRQRHAGEATSAATAAVDTLAVQPEDALAKSACKSASMASVAAAALEAAPVEVEGGGTGGDPVAAGRASTTTTAAAITLSGGGSDHVPSMDRSTGSKRGSSNRLLHFVAPYGKATLQSTSGGFPNIGSTLGNYFCLGQLGKGTFSSIHQCINMSYFYRHDAAEPSRRHRLAAAKVELSTFAQSGVLDAEATLLDFLHQSCPEGTVPVYMGHYKSGQYAAIVMEYLPGQDMHQLREQVMTGTQSRRIAVRDAVFLTADVMLPLLQRMHEVGVVHRDVKPSNCVRSSPSERKFCLVDFGLSKSVVVPADSPHADPAHPWPDEQGWLRPAADYRAPACYRKEREKADFRGTSMYASLRVHQSCDYCARDDMWSLMYVFCDLVSGGLPWMQHAADRQREACQTLKEEIHGIGTDGKDRTERLLMGDQYHVQAYRREQKRKAGQTENLPELPEPLAMCRDERKVNYLRTAFNHLGGLHFWDVPDYDLLRRCIHGFMEDSSNHPLARPITYEVEPVVPPIRMRRGESLSLRTRKCTPRWEIEGLNDPLDADVFAEAEEFETTSQPPAKSIEDELITRLPLKLRYNMAQVAFNEDHQEHVPRSVIMRDWMKLAISLLYDDWDARKYEDGGHRTSTDGYRRDHYLLRLRQCYTNAEKQGFFRNRDFFVTASGARSGAVSGAAASDATDGPTGKRRKGGRPKSNLVTVSRILFGLEQAIKAEERRILAPPPQLSFGGRM